MTTELFSDNAATTLTSSPSSGATSFTVASSTGFPAAVTGTSQFRIIIGTEIITVTNVSGTTWTCVATAAAHTSADVVTHVLTAASLGNFVDGKVATSIPLTQKGAASGVATLDAGGLIPAAQIGGAWSAYTPVWTAATTNPVLGNGTLTGWYKQLPDKTVHLDITLTAGTTTTFGSGVMKLSLPVASDQSLVYHGSGQGASGASGNPYPVLPVVGVGFATFLYFYVSATTAAGPLNLLSHTGLAGVAWTATSANMLRASITYQAA